MRTLLTLAFSCFFLFGGYAQAHHASLKRLKLDSTLAPFYHGVASGDPLSDAVIIWTRVTTQDISVDVDWVISTDVDFASAAASGTFTTDASRDYTVKVDVSGLAPNTVYYYQFTTGGASSLIGRTKTAPTGDNDNVRIAVVSCSNYTAGYFNAYNAISKRDDIDAVLHLGDYIYEYGGGSADRPLDPPTEIITLDDYRARYSHYRLDEDLRAVHQQHAFISVWDDHETANDSYKDGAQNHDASEGDWEVRKKNGVRVYNEWMPIRQPDVNDTIRIYRKINYGNLVNLYMLDTRLYGRDEQGSGTDADREMLGPDQKAWILNELNTSTAKWNVIGQQVVFTEIPLVGTSNEDAWWGYPTDRDDIINAAVNNTSGDLVVLTGDVHTAWSSDIVTPTYDENTQANSAGVEFVCNSVTSSGLGTPVTLGLVQQLAPNVKYVETELKGYIVVDFRDTSSQCDFYDVSTIDTKTYNETYDGGNYTLAGTRYLKDNVAASTPLQKPVGLAPLNSGNASAHNPLLIIGTYPNPFVDQLQLQYYVEGTQAVSIQLVDMQGKSIYKDEMKPAIKGVNYSTVNMGKLSAGNYLLTISQGANTYSRQVQVR